MKTAFFSPICLILAAVFFETTAARAAPTTNSATATTTVATNVVPKAVYSVPTTFAEGRDPFFPNRRGVAVAVQPVQVHTGGIQSLALKSIGGTPGHRIVLINTRT